MISPIRAISQAFAVSPGSAALTVAASIGLTLFVAMASIPPMLATSQPDIALMFNPWHPGALVAKANRLRSRLLATLKSTGGGAEAGHDGTAAAATSPEDEAERTRLIGEIRDLARRALLADPLNARALRLLADTQSDPDTVRTLMTAALARSRRETEAGLWLMIDAMNRRDFPESMRLMDILLRTSPEITGPVFRFASDMARDLEGRAALVERLGIHPPWRAWLLSSLSHTLDQDTSLAVLVALKDRGDAPSEEQIGEYLNVLAKTGRVDAAYNAWLRFLPPERQLSLGLLSHPGFDRVGNHPFEWQIARGLNAMAEIGPLPGDVTRTGLHVTFGNGRSRFPEVYQHVVLPDGRYRIAVSVRGQVIAKRGLVWQVVCGSQSRRLIGQTEPIRGDYKTWKVVQGEFTVAGSADCAGQIVRLIHDARSASEELASGEAWFDKLELVRID